jgi:hypothetical protein
LKQLNIEGLSTDHCFLKYLKYYKIDLDTIEFAKDTIMDILPLKHLNQIFTALKRVCSVRYVNETVKQHSSKQSGVEKPKIDLILMFEHYMVNLIVDKYDNIISNRTIKL